LLADSELCRPHPNRQRHYQPQQPRAAVLSA